MTSLCIKRSDSAFRFWGVFWIDSNTHESIKRGLTQLSPFKKDNSIGFDLESDTGDDDKDAESEDSVSDANEERSFKNDIAKITGTLGLAKKQEAPRACNVDRVLKTLSMIKEPWLIIFDNADDDELKLEPYLPVSEFGSILVTTRNEHLEMKGGAQTVSVNSLGAEDALEVFRKARNVDPAQWHAKSKKYIDSVRDLLIEQLGGLPLAISMRDCPALSDSFH